MQPRAAHRAATPPFKTWICDFAPGLERVGHAALNGTDKLVANLRECPFLEVDTQTVVLAANHQHWACAACGLQHRLHEQRALYKFPLRDPLGKRLCAGCKTAEVAATPQIVIDLTAEVPIGVQEDTIFIAAIIKVED
jgi:hypothetical protein